MRSFKMIHEKNKNPLASLIDSSRIYDERKATESFVNKKKEDCKFNVPFNLFQTWETKVLPPLMSQAVKYLTQENPEFTYYLYDDNDCREFIRLNYDFEVLDAYDKLIPGAYKADLWRLCILYKMGGVYLDIKYIPINGFKLYNLLEREHWTTDVNPSNIYNAVLVCKAGNQILLNAINKIVENVQNKFYGNGFLEPTGPALLGKYFSNTEKYNSQLKHIANERDCDLKYILFKGKYVMKSYNGYFTERKLYSKLNHYSVLWNKKLIYKQDQLNK
jgi:mannosyltransferase OCH1-like enzyme